MGIRYPVDTEYLPDDHNCWEERCTPYQHYGQDVAGLCLVCGGCGDPECCIHDDECFPPNG
jgi:hypothetical protein